MTISKDDFQVILKRLSEAEIPALLDRINTDLTNEHERLKEMGLSQDDILLHLIRFSSLKTAILTMTTTLGVVYDIDPTIPTDMRKVLKLIENKDE